MTGILDLLINRIDPSQLLAGRVAGIVGDSPSQYAKSPAIWNPAFKALGIDAVYLPFDVPAEHLKDFMEAARGLVSLLGFNVTVPYKTAVMEFLDGAEDKARAIGAVNTVVRDLNGRLIGYNTDGQGALDSLTKVPLDGEAPFFPTVEGARVLLLGAGGAGKAISHYLGEAVGVSGELIIANRDAARARALAEDVHSRYGVPTHWVTEREVGQVISRVSLIVNTTSKGQTGIRSLPDGGVTCLEPYSALAPAAPVILQREEVGQESSDFYRRWFAASWDDVEANNRASVHIIRQMPAEACLFDAVYAPSETTFLRHGRLAGHPGLNGKGMNIYQAVDAFFNKVCAGYLEEQGIRTPATYTTLLKTMSAVW